jgi:hypothetical protein
MDFSTRKNGIRLLLLLAVLIGAAAVVQDLHFDNTLASTRSALFGVDSELASLNVKLADFRAAQAAYLASGQDATYWMTRASALGEEITASVARIKPTVDAETAARLNSAATAFAALTESDLRARQNLADGQTTAANDAIFKEGLGHAERASSELVAARWTEISAAERAMAGTGQTRLATTGGAIGIVLLLAFFAVKLGGQPQVSAAATMAQMLRELPPPVKTVNSAGTLDQGATAIVARPAAPLAKAAPAPVSSVNLPDAAELCGDLARVIDGRDVPALLARAAGILEASGVIVWMADVDGSRLQPMLTHGYSDKVLSKLGALATDADNVTSLAFRSRRSQQVNGAGAAGAIAIPLVTASGCTGVLAAEVKESRLAPDAVALARIIAAQFATIIAPVETADARAAEA